MKKKKISLTSVFKIIFQIIFFITLPGLYINAFAGIKEIYVSLINSTFSFVEIFPYMVETIAIIPITILLGRFFCGWMCAMGAYGDFLYMIGTKVFKVKVKVPESTHHILKYLKFIVLAFTIIAIWTLNLTAISNWSPNNVFGSLADIQGILNIKYIVTEMMIGFLIFLTISILSIFIERFYCKYLCPLGAIFVLISPLRITKIHKPRENCGSCTLCTAKCKMSIPLYKYDKVSSGECIQCNKCIQVCPKDNAHLSAFDQKVPMITSALIAIGAIVLIYIGGMSYSNSLTDNSLVSTTDTTTTSDNSTDTSTDTTDSDTSTDTSTDTTDSDTSTDTSTDTTDSDTSTDTSTDTTSSTGQYTDGTYEGSGTGFRGGTTTVQVTISNGEISDIEVVSYDDDKPYFQRAYSSVVSAIIDSQSTDVDGVSGATYSSNGIKDAVADALSQAQ